MSLNLAAASPTASSHLAINLHLMSSSLPTFCRIGSCLHPSFLLPSKQDVNLHHLSCFCGLPSFKNLYLFLFSVWKAKLSPTYLITSNHATHFWGLSRLNTILQGSLIWLSKRYGKEVRWPKAQAMCMDITAPGIIEKNGEPWKLKKKTERQRRGPSSGSDETRQDCLPCFGFS